jgi:hypothetical protein
MSRREDLLDVALVLGVFAVVLAIALWVTP